MKNNPNLDVRKSLIRIAVVTGAVLVVPVIGMQVSEDVNWGREDFIFALALVMGAGFAYEFLIRNIQNAKKRILATFALLLILALIWAEAAVGIFGSPIAGS